MKIQSLSVVVPNKGCVNNCKFCVSKMHCDTYKNQMDNFLFFDLYLKDYIKRLEFARDNGCNTVMITGTSEPQQNLKFLTYFGMMLQLMKNPFRWIEIQTTGVMLDQNYLRFLRNHVGVNLIALSISSFDNLNNNMIIGTPPAYFINLEELCKEIKRYDFALRLSLNMTTDFSMYPECPKMLFDKCNDFHADQVTLRYLYSSGQDTPQDKWISENGMQLHDVTKIQNYVKNTGKTLGVLPHGSIKYSIDGLSTVVDTDCMDKGEKVDENYKYLILQPNCKLYSQWDAPASLIF